MEWSQLKELTKWSSAALEGWSPAITSQIKKQKSRTLRSQQSNSLFFLRSQLHAEEKELLICCLWLAAQREALLGAPLVAFLSAPSIDFIKQVDSIN